MSDRNQKANKLFDSALDHMISKVSSGEMERGDLKTILDFLDKQGINCIGTKNKKVGSIMDKLPMKVAVDNVRNG